MTESNGDQLVMDNELEMKIRQRAHEMWEGESCPDGLAERHWLEAEREVTEEAENAATAATAATAAAPAQGTGVEERTDAAKTVEAA
jgi:Protein of unknown function (DUF2934)